MRIKRGRRWVACSDSHGQYIDRECAAAFLAFVREYKPHRKLHLGDWNDQTAFMGKSLADRGSPEACASIADDLSAGAEFLAEYRPHVLFQGNHDHRPYKLLHHPNQIIAAAARSVCGQMESFARQLGAELVPYAGVHSPAAWRLLGDVAFGHGIMFGTNACEEHCRLLGRSCVFGHTHRVDVRSARAHGGLIGRTIGTLADIDQLHYAHASQSTAAWRNAWAFGEYGDNWCSVEVHVWRGKTNAQPAIPSIH